MQNYEIFSLLEEVIYTKIQTIFILHYRPACMKRKLEHEHTKISYINKLFEFKIHTNLNSLDKTLRFLVRF